METVFYPVPVNDVLEIISCSIHDLHTQQEKMDLVIFSISGLAISGSFNDNLCVKAYRLLKKDFPDLPPVKMHLHKVIPMGAGLGGGSADGAFTLRLLNEKYQLNLTNTQLINYAVMLGSDCPFFIINKPCFAGSRGEMMEVISLDLSDYTTVLVNCGIHINTGWAFSQLGRTTDQQEEARPLKNIIQGPVAGWKDILGNDFEQPVFRSYPALKDIKDALYSQGAVYAAMSGSGSTVFGLFAKDKQFVNDFPVDYEVIVVKSP